MRRECHAIIIILIHSLSESPSLHLPIPFYIDASVPQAHDPRAERAVPSLHQSRPHAVVVPHTVQTDGVDVRAPLDAHARQLPRAARQRGPGPHLATQDVGHKAASLGQEMRTTMVAVFLQPGGLRQNEDGDFLGVGDVGYLGS